MGFFEVTLNHAKYFIAVVIGYVTFAIVVEATGLVTSMWDFSIIMMYFFMITAYLFLRLIYFSIRSVVRKKYNLFHIGIYLIVGLIIMFSWGMIIRDYFQTGMNNTFYDYHDFYKSSLLVAKMFLVLMLIWFNFSKFSKIKTTKHILETILLISILTLFDSKYFLQGKLEVDILDIAMTYYLAVYVFQSARKNLTSNSMRTSEFVIPGSLMLIVAFVDTYGRIHPFGDNVYTLGCFVACGLYTMVFFMLTEDIRYFHLTEYKIVDNLTLRAYISIKDTCTWALDIALLGFLLNINQFNTLEMSIFLIGLVSIVVRHVLIGFQRDADEYNFSNNVVYVGNFSKSKLFRLGIDRSDIIFSAIDSGVSVFDIDEERIAYNKKLLEIFEVDTPDEIYRLFNPIDFEMFKIKIEQAYEGNVQEVSIRQPISDSEQRVYDVVIRPIVVKREVQGIELSVVDYKSKYMKKASLSSLSLLGELIYEENRKVFLERIQEDIDRGVTNGVLVSIAISNLESEKNFLPRHVLASFKLRLLDSIEKVVPRNSVIFYEAEATYDIYMRASKEEVFEICQKLHDENSWTKKVKGYTVIQEVTQSVFFYEDVDCPLENWIHRLHILRQMAENEVEPYLVYTGEYKKFLEMRHFIQSSIKESIANYEFFMVYQPKVDSTTNEVVSLEALVRWVHPKRGVIPPGDFIPIVEESNDIVVLGTWIFEEVVRQQIEWRKLGLKIVPISINVGTKQFYDKGFLDLILNLYNNYPLEVGDIAIELTERDDLLENRAFYDLLIKLKDIGYDIQIDDFGIGKTTIAALVELPVSTVKIDRSIISRVDEPKYRQIVSSLKQIADELEIEVVSEGVERKEEVEILTSLGCTNIQGYYYYHPLPSSEVKYLLEQ